MPVSNIDLLNQKWKPGSRFRVRDIISSDGSIYVPDATYLIRSDTHIERPDGAMIIVSPTGKIVLSDYVIWMSDHLGLSPELSFLIKKHPESKYIPGFMRQEIGTAPTKKRGTPKTEEGWMEFVKKAIDEEKKRTEAAAKKAKTPAPAPPAPVIRMVNIPVKASESVRGVAYFTRVDTLSGEVPVPEEVLAGGDVRSVIDYLYDHLRDHCRRREGDMDIGDSHIDESDGLDIISHGGRNAIAAIAEEARHRQ